MCVHACTPPPILTQLLQHFVTLVQDKVLDVLGVEGLILDQGQDSSRGTNHNMGAVVLQNLLILLDADTTKEDRDLDVVKVLAETLVLLVNLEGQLPRMCTKLRQGPHPVSRVVHILVSVTGLLHACKG